MTDKDYFLKTVYDPSMQYKFPRAGGGEGTVSDQGGLRGDGDDDINGDDNDGNVCRFFFVHSMCRCELDISDCQQPVPLGGSCQARGRLLDVGYYIKMTI